MRRFSRSTGALGLLGLLVGVLGAARVEARGKGGAVVGEVTVLKDGVAKADLSGVVVSLDDVPGPPPAPVKDARMRQNKLAFEPRLLVVTKGSTVEFSNDDIVLHNVFSLSAGTRFDLGLYRSGTSRTVTFGQAGVVRIFCKIHPDMSAKIKVLDTSFYAVTGPDGTFRIDNVPPGRYPMMFWHANGELVRSEVVVTEGPARVPKVTLTERPTAPPIPRQDATPYDRYP